MRVTSIRTLLFLTLAILATTALPAQEGPPGDGGPQAEVSSMGILGALADPDLVAKPIDRPGRRLVVRSQPWPGPEAPPAGSLVVDGRLQPLGKQRFGDQDEFVLARLEGPGVITRIWMERPLGRLRLRYEGRSEPVLDLDCEALRKGIIRLFEPPLGLAAGEGFESLRPIPFGGPIVLSCDHPRGHWSVEARLHEEGTTVEEFTTTAAIGESFPLAPIMAGVRAAAESERLGPARPDRARVIARPDAEAALAPGAKTVLFDRKVAGPRLLESIELETIAPFAATEIVPGLEIRVVVDGVTTLALPLDLLFGGPGFAARSSLHLKIDEPLAGRIRRRRLLLPQPFEKALRIELHNRGETRSPSLRFRFGLGEASETIAKRRLTGRVLDAATPRVSFPETATLVAEALLAAGDETALDELALGPVGSSLRERLGAGTNQWSNVFASGSGRAGALAAWRSRLLDRHECPAGAEFELIGEIGSARYLLLAYVDCRPEEER